MLSAVQRRRESCQLSTSRPRGSLTLCAGDGQDAQGPRRITATCGRPSRVRACARCFFQAATASACAGVSRRPPPPVLPPPPALPHAAAGAGAEHRRPVVQGPPRGTHASQTAVPEVRPPAREFHTGVEMLLILTAARTRPSQPWKPGRALPRRHLHLWLPQEQPTAARDPAQARGRLEQL